MRRPLAQRERERLYYIYIHNVFFYLYALENPIKKNIYIYIYNREISTFAGVYCIGRASDFE